MRFGSSSCLTEPYVAALQYDQRPSPCSSSVTQAVVGFRQVLRKLKSRWHHIESQERAVTCVTLAFQFLDSASQPSHGSLPFALVHFEAVAFTPAFSHSRSAVTKWTVITLSPVPAVSAVGGSGPGCSSNSYQSGWAGSKPGPATVATCRSP